MVGIPDSFRLTESNSLLHTIRNLRSRVERYGPVPGNPCRRSSPNRVPGPAISGLLSRRSAGPSIVRPLHDRAAPTTSLRLNPRPHTGGLCLLDFRSWRLCAPSRFLFCPGVRRPTRCSPRTRLPASVTTAARRRSCNSSGDSPTSSSTASAGCSGFPTGSSSGTGAVENHDVSLETEQYLRQYVAANGTPDRQSSPQSIRSGRRVATIGAEQTSGRRVALYARCTDDVRLYRFFPDVCSARTTTTRSPIRSMSTPTSRHWACRRLRTPKTSSAATCRARMRSRN